MTPIEQLSNEELDALVAEKIMEYARVAEREYGNRWALRSPMEATDMLADDRFRLATAQDKPFPSFPRTVPRYSTNMAAAWQVVEKMAELGYWCSLKSPFFSGQPCWAGFTPHNTTGWNGRPDFSAGHKSPSRAICLAALRAKGVTEVDDGTRMITSSGEQMVSI